MKRFLLILVLCFPCWPQAWSGILSSSRAITWTSAGLPATLPDGETTPNPWTPPTRTQCGSTISSGASVATINAALAACTAGHYVLLGVGTFTLAGTENNCYGGGSGIACISLYAQNGVTLRGSGPQSTTIILTGNSLIAYGEATGSGSATWSAGYSQGATSLTYSGSTLTTGKLAFLTQCDSGFSGTNCATGSTSDNGGLYICGDNAACQINPGGASNSHQQQTVYVTNVAGSTVTFVPGLYMPNWASGNSPIISWNDAFYGNGLEDLTLDMRANTYGNGLFMTDAYASWIKGVRVIGTGASEAAAITFSKNCLWIDNYFYLDLISSSNDGISMQEGNDSDNLIVNNVMTGGVPWEGVGSTEGNVVAFNYGRDAHTTYYENRGFQHNAGNAFMLYEGNQVSDFDEDATHGTHDLNAWFRNYMSGWDPPYQTVDPAGLQFDMFARFENAIGNSIGSTLLTNYQSTHSSPQANFVFEFNNNTTSDPLVQSSAMRWGNYDNVTGAVRWCGNSSDTGWSSTCASTSEVPTSLAGNAAPFDNTVPSTETLPASFFLPTTAHPSGGTGLSWWKVCKTWTSFPTSCSSAQTQPFPVAGPDVTGGPYLSGFAYDIPAAIAFANLPIDTAYQNSYTITNSSYNAGIETLTVSSLPAGIHTMGPMQISGGNCDTAGAEVYMTGSDATHISYARGSSASCTTGSVKWPDIRQFDEAVYQSDPSGAAAPTCDHASGTYGGAFTNTCLTVTGGTVILCWSTSTLPVTNGAGTGCTTGTSMASGGSTTISSTETFNIVAGSSTLADSSETVYSYTINNAAPGTITTGNTSRTGNTVKQ